MKKFLKITGAILVTFILFLAIYYFANNESLPEGTKGKAADELAQKMMQAINKEAFDTTEILEWSFRGEHQYKWKKQEGLVEVSWDHHKVTLNLNDASKSQGESPEIIQTALDYFNNDSFWLIAPYKVFDEGVTRSIASNAAGEKGLLVTYSSGGTTPGDSYMWFLDENDRPKGYQMWVGIIPIGGLYASWDNWQTTETGVPLSSLHTLLILDVDLQNIKTWN